MAHQPPTTPRIAPKALTLSHLLLSVLITALGSGGDAAYQYISSNGLHFSAVQLTVATLFAFGGAMGTGLVSLEKNPTVEQAIDGRMNQWVGAFEQLYSRHAGTATSIESVANDMQAALAWLTDQLRQQQQAQNTPPPAPAASAAPPVQVAFPPNVNAAAGAPATSSWSVVNSPPSSSAPPAQLTRNFTGLSLPTP